MCTTTANVPPNKPNQRNQALIQSIGASTCIRFLHGALARALFSVISKNPLSFALPSLKSIWCFHLCNLIATPNYPIGWSMIEMSKPPLFSSYLLSVLMPLLTQGENKNTNINHKIRGNITGSEWCQAPWLQFPPVFFEQVKLWLFSIQQHQACQRNINWTSKQIQFQKRV